MGNKKIQFKKSYVVVVQTAMLLQNETISEIAFKLGCCRETIRRVVIGKGSNKYIKLVLDYFKIDVNKYLK